MWNDHFPSPSKNYLYQGVSQKLNFLKIWVNLEDVLLNNHFSHMKKDEKYEKLKY